MVKNMYDIVKIYEDGNSARSQTFCSFSETLQYLNKIERVFKSRGEEVERIRIDALKVKRDNNVYIYETRKKQILSEHDQALISLSIRKKVEEIEGKIDFLINQLQPSYGLIGHNNPPQDHVLESDELKDIAQKLRAIRSKSFLPVTTQQLYTDEDIDKLSKYVTKIIWYCAEKLNKGLDAATEMIVKSLVVWVLFAFEIEDLKELLLKMNNSF